ncbi:serine hydrolase domain-containing protein [Paenibacillus sp. MMS18-CY102]|uniref:serine hydrolase domain-containing protein n=1 Tax=Paenibacillus sp. MMS18-CY102 TaxID=2682849 RepID=UPI0013655DE6|nr:serine hydrolase [Paenibacillus sp. MMS18-CY102]MWC30213.1 serine hydrolase [Paenibacillus sp. MMS18-CY102]
MPRNEWPTAEWQTADPETLGMDKDKLSALPSIIQADYSNISGIVIVRNGIIAYEQYYNGYGTDASHHVTSVTKSILSALIGIAIDAEYIKHADQSVLDFFPEYVPHADAEKKRSITLRHLLTMTAPYPFQDWNEPLDQLCMQPDWVNYTLDMLGEQGNIGDFKYATAGAHLLSAIITRVTGQSARAFANERLFRPIGMQEIPDFGMESFGFDDLFGRNVKGWVQDPSGNSTGGWGLTLNVRDMARFGFLYLNHGMWDGSKIVSSSWIAESTTMNPNKYGYLWWLGDEDGIPAYLALGDGGNAICCIPDKGLVVAIASTFISNPRDRWTLVKENIIPAVRD